MTLRAYCGIAVLTVLIMLAASPAFADLEDWNVNIVLNEDRTTDWTVSLRFNETVSRADYFVLTGISGLQASLDDREIECDVKLEIGTSIVCEGISGHNVTFEFSTPIVVDTFRDFRSFSQRFSLTRSTDRFSLTVKLPVGAALAADNDLRGTGLKKFEPGFGTQGSDGRRIFVRWVLEDPSLGDALNAQVVYEQFSPEEQFGVFIIIFIIVVGAIVVFIAQLFRRRVQDILPVLNENERKVMEIVLREEEVDQRQIVKETDFSKAKVSRLIKNLEERGLIEKVSKGRKNLIKMKRQGRLQKTSKDEGKS